MDLAEDDRIPISALQHYVYCPRQCALIHLEQTFDENIFTLRGQRLHERVHEEGAAQREGARLVRALPLWSETHRLIGKADVVEFTPQGDAYPVEHKSGRRKAHLADDVQLCAQAICLEEMLGRRVERGAIFHHASKRRREVVFTAQLRNLTLETAVAVRRLFASTAPLPPPVADARCHNCSLLDACMPHEVKRLSHPGSSTS